jgi:catechol 2,3-dioxygenase-like lactoylglutathione lyase family enzyme
MAIRCPLLGESCGYKPQQGRHSMPDLSGSRIDHLNIGVPDLARSVAFYDPVLASIGITTLLRVPADPSSDQRAMHGFGIGAKPFFWLVASERVGTDVHIGFTVDTREAVHAFHDAALAHGATELQAPASHPEYHDNYYGGFVLDHDGINIEAVCHHPQPDGR